MKDVIIARELIKIAKQLCSTSYNVQQNDDGETVQQLMDTTLKQGWDFLLQRLIEYRNHIQEYMNEYAEKRKTKYEEVNKRIKIAEQIIENNPNSGVSISPSDLKDLQRLSPVFPKLDSSKESLRRKCDALMHSGGIIKVFNAFAKLIAREQDICAMGQSYVQHINKVINDSGFIVNVRRGKQGNLIPAVQKFFEAAETRGRLSGKIKGAQVIRNNLVVTLTTLSGDVIAYDSVSNAYVQLLETVSEDTTIQKFKEFLDAGYEYDQQNKVWFDPITKEIKMDLKKVKTPEKVSSLKTAGFIDWIKNLGIKVVQKSKELYNKAKSLILSMVSAKEKEQELEDYNEQLVSAIEQQKKMFDELVSELTKK